MTSQQKPSDIKHQSSPTSKRRQNKGGRGDGDGAHPDGEGNAHDDGEGERDEDGADGRMDDNYGIPLKVEEATADPWRPPQVPTRPPGWPPYFVVAAASTATATIHPPSTHPPSTAHHPSGRHHKSIWHRRAWAAVVGGQGVQRRLQTILRAAPTGRTREQPWSHEHCIPPRH